MTTCTTSCEKSGCCENLAKKEEEDVNRKEDEIGLSCWAVIGERDVWLFDARGVSKRFTLPPGTNETLSNLCFATHGTSHDDLLTPCFDENGRHGVPVEDCFCGEGEPHLHAHWHHPQNCDRSTNKSSVFMEVERLANLMLVSSKGEEEKEEENHHHPLTTFREWPCGNSFSHLRRQGKDQLLWVDDPCNDCTHEYVNRKVPSFRLSGTRVWKDVTTKRYISLHFFQVNEKGEVNLMNKDNREEKDCSSKGSSPCRVQDDSEKLRNCYKQQQKDSAYGKEQQQRASSSCCDKPKSEDVKDCCKEESKKKGQSQDCCTTERSTANKSTSCCNNNSDKATSCCNSQETTSLGCCDTKNDPSCHSKATSACCVKNKDEDPCSSGNTTVIQVEPMLIEKGIGRSQFRVGGLCCASEVPIIHGILDGTPGIEKVAVNPTTKIVFVDHEPTVIAAARLAAMMNARGMGAEVQIDAAESLGTTRQSLFVVSKYKLGNNADRDRIEILLKTYDATEVESFVLDERGALLTVIHNPWTIVTTEISSALQEGADCKVEIILNGSDQNREPLDYEVLAKSKSASSEKTGASSENVTWPRPTVVLSGLFWIISMLSFIGHNWEYLKYAALASVTFGLPPIAKKAIGTLRQQLRFDANGLMFLASIGALALGEFPEAAAVVFLFALSEWLESRASSRARMALSAMVQLRPDTARIIDPETQKLWTVPADVVPVGSLVSVKTGDKVPCDGIVVEGQSTVDESSLTGESRPIRKVPKDRVSGGTVNTGVRQLVVRTTSTADDSAVARLIRLVEEAQMNRSETEKSVDEFAKFYTPVLMLTALLMCSVPWVYGTETGKKWTHNGLVLIVVACPCALIISTPVTYVAGLAAAAQKGVLIKGGTFLEALGQLSHICFDKTGTLTTGEFSLLHMDVVGDSLTRQQVLQYLLLIEERAAHPVAQAIMSAARNEGVSIPKGMVLQKHTILAGEGVTGVIDKRNVFVGNERLFERLGILADLPSEISERVKSWKSLGGTIGFISIGDYGIVGIYCAADAVRPEAASVIRNFQKRGIALTMLTGDNEEAALSVGAQLNWRGENNDIHAKLLPADKLSYIEELTATSVHLSKPCYRKHIVLFCGDGVNDSPALAAAHVGVAMGSGATVAMETAHVTLLDPSLQKLEFAQELGRRVLIKIAENVIFSVGIKAAVLVWAILGEPGLWVAIGSDVGSMLLVTLNSMRLLPSRPKGSNSTLSEMSGSDSA